MIGRRKRDPDQRLLRRVRWRLIAWSGGATVVLFVTLGAAMYWAVATTLAAQSVADLEARAENLQIRALKVSDAGQLLHDFKDASTWDPGLLTIESAESSSARIAPAAKEAEVGGRLVRSLTTSIRMNTGPPLVVTIFVDRAAEVLTLRTLLLVLVLGGLVLVLASLVVGYLYAGAALVPIRDSLRRQREFTADASHELRTPLAIVGTALEQLRRKHDDPVAIERTIEDIEIGTGRLGRMIDDLLLLARMDSDSVELVLDSTDLADVAAEGLAGLVALADRGGVRLSLDVEPAPVLGDQAHLRQLVGILVDNAIRQSPKGGTVRVRVRPGASLEVEDEGPGIRVEDLPCIFDRFWRAADAPAGGTGLGLPIARLIADRHGGQLIAENRAQGGACLRFSMPGA